MPPSSVVLESFYATATEARQCNIVIMTAGAKQVGESSQQKPHHHRSPIRNDDVFLLVPNPIEVSTYFAQRLSELPKGQVIGAGTSWIR